jgi:hypothetical protein
MSTMTAGFLGISRYEDWLTAETELNDGQEDLAEWGH